MSFDKIQFGSHYLDHAVSFGDAVDLVLGEAGNSTKIEAQYSTAACIFSFTCPATEGTFSTILTSN